MALRGTLLEDKNGYNRNDRDMSVIINLLLDNFIDRNGLEYELLKSAIQNDNFIDSTTKTYMNEIIEVHKKNRKK